MNLFLLKKLISNLVHLIPGLLFLMVVALLIARWFPRTAHSIIFLALCTLMLAASPAGSNRLVSYLEDQHAVLQQVPDDTHSVLILGSGHTWVPARPPNSVLSAVSLSRMTEGVRLWKQNPETTLITSGAEFYEELSHAEAAANMALMAGVDAKSIIRFTESLDTAQEIQAVVNHVRENPVKGKNRIVIVSSATHLPRAALMLSRFNIPYTLAPTDFLYIESPWYRFNSSFLLNSDRAIHEYVGMLWHRLTS